MMTLTEEPAEKMSGSQIVCVMIYNNWLARFKVDLSYCLVVSYDDCDKCLDMIN